MLPYIVTIVVVAGAGRQGPRARRGRQALRQGVTPAPRPIILDCDPGHDDAMAILLAAQPARLELRAITTVAGNSDASRR